MDVVSFINMKGGVAKTTLAVNFADVLCERFDKSVLVVDIDPQFNATQCLMNGEDYMKYVKNGGITIVDIFESTSRTAPGIVTGRGRVSPKKLEDIEPIEIKDNYYLLPGALELFKVKMPSGEGRENRLKKFLDINKENYDIVVIDTPPTPSVWMSSALIASGYYVIPVKPDPISFTGMDLLHGIIAEKKDNYGLDIKCVGVVFTIVEERLRVYRAARKSLSEDDRWEKYLIKSVLLKRTEISREQLNQKFILSTDDTNLKKNLLAITRDIISRIEKC